MPIFDLISYSVFTALQVVLLGMILRRRDYRRYPFFFIYVAGSVIATVVQLLLVEHPVAYFVAHCAGEVLYAVLALLAIAEVFKPKLELLYEGHGGLRYCLLPGTLLSMAGIGVWQGIYHPFGTTLLGRLTPAAWGFVIGVRCLESVLYFAAWVVTKSGRMAMAERPFKILTGFGLAAFFSLLGYLGRYQFGAAWEMTFRYLPFGAYIASTCLWLGAFLKPEPPRMTPKPELAKVQALLDFQRGEKDMLGKLKNKLRWSTFPTS